MFIWPVVFKENVTSFMARDELDWFNKSNY